MIKFKCQAFFKNIHIFTKNREYFYIFLDIYFLLINIIFMKSIELKKEHLERIKLLMLKLINKEKRYLTEFFKLPQLNCKNPRERAYQYKKNNIINKKVLKKIEIIEKSFE